MDNNKLSYDQHFSELPWTKSWFQKFIGEKQGKYKHERAKSNNSDTSGIE